MYRKIFSLLPKKAYAVAALAFVSLSLPALTVFTSCADSANNICVPDGGKSATNGEPDWSDSAMWYGGAERLAAASDTLPDVFYLLPTCVTAWQDAEGRTHYNADPANPDHREAWRLSAELADTVFASRANLFLPYCRQAVFEGLEGEHAAEAARTAEEDAKAAFDYYLAHFNGGRPFVLAGYSQGGRLVTEVLKHISDEDFSRLIAAYVVGYGVTAADTVALPGQRVPHIKLAADAASRGVTVNFNSVTDTSAVCPLLCEGNVGCINPVSWTTDTVPAVLLPAGAKAGEDDPRFPYATAVAAADGTQDVTVRVDKRRKVLVVDGIDAQRYHFQPLDGFFPVGNLHLQELFFFVDHLRRNVLLRSGQ